MATATPRRPGAEALKAFAHPLRMAMFEHLAEHGPATATQLATALDESTGQTSYHLRQLAKHGFVEDDPDHQAGRERWWRPVGFTISGDDFADEQLRDALLGMVAARSINRSEQAHQWLSRLHEEPSHWREASLSVDGRSRMTAGELDGLTTELSDVLTRHLAEAKERARAGDGQERRAVRVHLEAFPVPPDTVEA